MFGIDLSNHQHGIDLSKFDFSFAIVKATEGRNYKDPSFENHISQLTGLNKLIGCYHYLRPDNQTTTSAMKREAHNFIESITKAGLVGRAILCADWEQQPTNRIDLLATFVEEVEKETTVTPFIYSSRSWFNSVNWSTLEFHNPLWVAWWPWMWEFKGFPTASLILKKFPEQTGGRIWQFTSNGKIPGYKGRVDFSYTDMNKVEWSQMACGKPTECISQDMQWAIDSKIFYGYPDGTYRPNEMLTRGQCASVLRRFYEVLLSAKSEEMGDK